MHPFIPPQHPDYPALGAEITVRQMESIFLCRQNRCRNRLCTRHRACGGPMLPALHQEDALQAGLAVRNIPGPPARLPQCLHDRKPENLRALGDCIKGLEELPAAYKTKYLSPKARRMLRDLIEERQQLLEALSCDPQRPSPPDDHPVFGNPKDRTDKAR